MLEMKLTTDNPNDKLLIQFKYDGSLSFWVTNDNEQTWNNIWTMNNNVSAGSISAELSGVTIYNNRLHKSEKVVHLYALINVPAISASGSWIASIPSEFRPSADRNIVGTAGDGTTRAFDISASGHLRNAESIPNKTYYFDSTWIL